MDLNLVPFSSLCRCCLASDLGLRPIFNPSGYIQQAVFLFTAVKFTKNDGGPENICINCLNQLDDCIRFKEKVENSDLQLQKYLQVKECLIKSLNLDETQPEYSCSDCKRTYASKYAYDRHRKVHESRDNVFRCNECGRKFVNRSIFEGHVNCHTKRNSHSGAVHSCQFCDESFATEADLLVHNSLHDTVNKLTCNACGKYFDNSRKLKRHLSSHFKEKPFKCNVCNMAFSEMASLTRHYQKHTEANRKSAEICSVCGKPFSNRYALKVHMRTHTGERPWECDMCPKSFTDFRLLNSHKLLHKDEKPHECKKCNKSFRHKSSLTAHLPTHNSDRPYRCNTCKKSYKKSWSLQAHKRTHNLNMKRFLCEQCSHMFVTETALQDHLREHGDQVTEDDQESPKSFQCKDCSARLSSRLDLITHEKLTHSLGHECDTCFGKWKTLEELVRHKCSEAALDASNEPTPDEMILLPNGQIQDCNTIVNALLASMSHPPTMTEDKTKL